MYGQNRIFSDFFASMDDHFNPSDSRWLEWVLEHENENTAELALRYSGKAGLPLEQLLHQIKGRKAGKEKIPTWYAYPSILYPDSLIPEQCSSEAAALFKSVFAKGKRVVDLTGGLGVDTWAFSRTADSVLYCEPDERRCRAAQHNFTILGRKNIQIQHTDALTFTQSGRPGDFDMAYLDPSRRTETGKKVFRLEDLQPNILEIKDRLLEMCGNVMIKLAPMLDISEGLRLLPETDRVDILSWKGECRELLFHLHKGGNEARIICHELENPSHDFEFSYREEKNLKLPVAEPGQWLYEPGSAIRKAGAWKSLCEAYSVFALHPNTHLFSSNLALESFPGRRFKLLEILPFRYNEIIEKMKGKTAQQVFYNFKEQPASVMKKTGIKSGDTLYLFFVTLKDGEQVVLMTEKYSI